MSVAELSTGKSSPYLEIQDKLARPFEIKELCKSWVVEWLAKNGYDKAASAVAFCGTKVVSLQCPNGHQKLVRTSCHKDFCPRCGRKKSLAHRRRYTRALDRLIWAPVLGYMVFTLPREVSDAMPSKEQLSKIEKEAVTIVKDNFSAPGCMARIHFMGEEPEHLHIHVNVLFPITDTNGKGKVPQATLCNIRQHWTTFVNQTFNLNNDITNVFYKFKTSEIKKRHTIKYVTRPVVVAEKFLSLSSEAKHWYLSLAGWHNTRWYGQLANNKYKELLRALSFGFGSANVLTTLARIYKMTGSKEKGQLAFEKAVCMIYKNLTHINPGLKSMERLIK